MRVNIARVVEAILEQPPAPCEGCAYNEFCEKYEMACERFAVYIGSVKLKGRTEDQLNKVPNRALYRCLYPKNHAYHGNSAEMRNALSGVGSVAA